MKANSLPVYQIDVFEDQKKEPLFYANTFGEHLRKHRFIEHTHGHNFYLTVLFTSGFGIHEIDFKKYAIVPGSLFTLKPGQVHNWKFSKNIDGYVFFHNSDFFKLLFNERSVLNRPEFFLNRKNPAIWLDVEKRAVFKPLFENLISEYDKNEVFKLEKACSLSFLIYLELTKIDENHFENNNQHIHYLNKISTLETLINERFTTLKLPHQYADLMYMTPKHLNRISKRMLGITVTQMITQRIVLEGKRLLVNPKRSIAQVAEALGYEDASYFTKVFKKSTGITPNNFRNA